MMKIYFAKLRTLFILMLILFGFNNKLLSQSNLYDINQIQEVKITFYESNWREILDSLFLNYGEEGRLVCDVSLNGKSFSKAGIRFKGFSSYDKDRLKNPFNVDLDYTYKHQNYQGYTKLKLGNVIYDPSFVREVVSYKIAQKYMPASQANFAKVYVNDYYLGLYTSVEAVDDSFVEKFFKSEGNSFFKGSPEDLVYPFGQNSNLAFTHGEDSTAYYPFYKLQSKYYGWSDLYNFIRILNIDTAQIPDVLNIDRALWMHAFNYALLNLDSYIGYSQNYYLYEDDNGRFNTIPWDLNMAFGSFRNTDGISLSLSIDKMGKLDPLQHLTANSYTPRPLMKKLFVIPRYRKMYLAHLRTIIRENFENNEYFLMAQDFQSIIQTEVISDTNKFYTDSDFQNNLTVDVGPTSGKIPGLKSIVDARMAYLSTYTGFSGYPVISEVSHQPQRLNQNQNVWITARIDKASSAILSYRNSSKAVFENVEMYDDGTHHDSLSGDGIYGASFNVSGKIAQYYIWTENDSTGTFSPERAEYEFYTIYPNTTVGDVVINEIKTFEDKTPSNFAKKQWIELFNNTNELINLEGFHLSTDSLNILQWEFPDTIIEAKSYFIIGLNNSYATSNVNSSLNINGQNGYLILSNQSNDWVDVMTWSELPLTKSNGRFPNGIGLFSTMNPSFAAFNSIPISDKTSFSIYPNPAKESFVFEINTQKQPLLIEIYNSISQLKIFTEYSTNQTDGIFSKTIDISNLSSGVYLIKVSWGENIEIQKLIKQ